METDVWTPRSTPLGNLQHIYLLIYTHQSWLVAMDFYTA